MRETLYDYNGLFNCLRPDEPIDLYARDATEEPEEVGTCDYCKSYNGEIPVSRFKMRDQFTGLIEIIDLCAECQEEDHIYRNKTILKVTKL